MTYLVDLSLLLLCHSLPDRSLVNGGNMWFWPVADQEFVFYRIVKVTSLLECANVNLEERRQPLLLYDKISMDFNIQASQTYVRCLAE